jgi:glycosyltransferase involved in cell wall biosynthesis
MRAGREISVVVPVYESADVVPRLVERLTAVLERRDAGYEVVLVDDGSGDGSWEAIVRAADSDERIRGLRLARNYGQHNALLAGIRAARHPTIVTLDDDLQNPPEEIPRLLEALEAGSDVVYGTPVEERTPFWRRIGTRLTKAALRTAMGAAVAARVSSFRAFRTDLRDAFHDFRGPYVSIDVLLSWATGSFAWVPVEHHDRAGGRSNYGFVRLATHALNVLTGFTTRPLRVASLMGLASTGLGMLLLAWVLGRYIVEGGSVPGFPFLASMIAIFSGVQLVTLGIIGEYLARMHVRIMDRPPYAIRAQAGAAPSSRSDER